MQNLDKETINKFKERGYSFEEIQNIDISVGQANRGEFIPFYEVMEEFYTNNKELTCMK